MNVTDEEGQQPGGAGGAEQEPIIIQPIQQPIIDDSTPLTNENNQQRNVKGYGVVDQTIDDDNRIYYGFDSEKLRRLRFIRKVYVTLLIQLGLTTAVCSVCMFNDRVRNYVINNIGLMIFGVIMSFIMLIVLFFVRRKPIWNFVCLIIWTLIEAYTVGVICGMYVAIGYEQVVIQAFILTIVLFLALTIFTMQSKWDFTFLGAGLFAALWILIFWGFINAIFGFHMTFLYSLFGAIIFSLLIIFDTSMLLRTKCFSEGNWILASINLYLDVVNLFLFLLDLLSSRRG